MISICVTYKPRLEQWERTRNSFRHNQDFEVCIIEDEDTAELPYSMRIKEKGKCPVHPTNASVYFSKGNKILLNNAECCHVGDIMGYVEKYLTHKNYIAFSCYSLAEGSKIEDIETIIKENNIAATGNGVNGWYNHPIHRPCGIFFCAAITRKNWQRLNGLDERFSDGVAMADLDFNRRVKKLGLELVIPEFPFVIHQWHYTEDMYEDKEGFKRNQLLREELIKEGNIKALNTIYTHKK